MAESQLMEFYDRVARYEKARSRGLGFEADGTLGRSYYLRPQKRSPLRVVLGLCAVALTLLSLKAAIILFVGEGVYADRIARMHEGQDMDRLGAALLQFDPASGFLVEQARIWAPVIKGFVRDG